MSETATLVPLTDLIPMLSAISDRNWELFKRMF
jgi:hypothetical protein